MATLAKTTVTVKGAPAALLRNEPNRDPLVFVHGGYPGSTPYCSGSHIWGPALDRFSATRGILVLELPGYGGTPAPAALSVDFYADWMQECLAVSQIRSCFVVGHDFGGLIALELASRAPSVVKGISVVSKRGRRTDRRRGRKPDTGLPSRPAVDAKFAALGV